MRRWQWTLRGVMVALLGVTIVQTIELNVDKDWTPLTTEKPETETQLTSRGPTTDIRLENRLENRPETPSTTRPNNNRRINPSNTVTGYEENKTEKIKTDNGESVQSHLKNGISNGHINIMAILSINDNSHRELNKQTKQKHVFTLGNESLQSTETDVHSKEIEQNKHIGRVTPNKENVHPTYTDSKTKQTKTRTEIEPTTKLNNETVSRDQTSNNAVHTDLHSGELDQPEHIPNEVNEKNRIKAVNSEFYSSHSGEFKQSGVKETTEQTIKYSNSITTPIKSVTSASEIQYKTYVNLNSEELKNQTTPNNENINSSASKNLQETPYRDLNTEEIKLNDGREAENNKEQNTSVYDKTTSESFKSVTLQNEKLHQTYTEPYLEYQDQEDKTSINETDKLTTLDYANDNTDIATPYLQTDSNVDEKPTNETENKPNLDDNNTTVVPKNTTTANSSDISTILFSNSVKNLSNETDNIPLNTTEKSPEIILEVDASDYNSGKNINNSSKLANMKNAGNSTSLSNTTAGISLGSSGNSKFLEAEHRLSLDSLFLNPVNGAAEFDPPEPREVEEAADYGIRMMNELIGVKEPELYRMGMWLDSEHPAGRVAAFSQPDQKALRLARYGYAALQASTKLVQQLSSTSGTVLESRTRPLQLPELRESLRKTVLHLECPLRGAVPCRPAATRYRTADGTCNNPNHPRRGSAFTPQQRFLPPRYDDGLQTVRRSVILRSPLPSARAVSTRVHRDKHLETPSVTLLLMQWGQFIDHDVTATPTSRAFNGTVPRCCVSGGQAFQPPEFMHPECLPIPVPADDWFLGRFGIRCMEFVRSAPTPREECDLGFRQQMNQVTSYIDASTIYGSSAQQADSLRLFRGGLLQYGRLDNRNPPDPPGGEICRQGAITTHCFQPGDTRASEQPALTAIHITWLRKHNQIAGALAQMNGHWSDEKVFQEARRIVGAMIQHITYREYLPIVLGQEVMKLFDLELVSKGYYTGYDSRVNPSPSNSFTAAAYRFGHSLVQKSFVRSDRFHRPIFNNVSIHEEQTNPENIWSFGSLDRMMLGMCNQPSQRRDEYISDELTNHLFQSPGFPFGMDLAAINIQRGRDHGIPPYTAWRVPCGLSPVTNWTDLQRVMSVETAQRFRSLYLSVDDIDLYSAGLAEKPVRGGIVGPTFACIIAQQFLNLRKGDRFWYENGNFESSFTPAQLQQIRKVTLAQIICETMPEVDTIQPFVLLSADKFLNQRETCRKLLNFDMTPWTERQTDNRTRLFEELDNDNIDNETDNRRSDNDESDIKTRRLDNDDTDITKPHNEDIDSISDSAEINYKTRQVDTDDTGVEHNSEDIDNISDNHESSNRTRQLDNGDTDITKVDSEDFDSISDNDENNNKTRQVNNDDTDITDTNDRQLDNDENENKAKRINSDNKAQTDNDYDSDTNTNEPSTRQIDRIGRAERKRKGQATRRKTKPKPAKTSTARPVKTKKQPTTTAPNLTKPNMTKVDIQKVTYYGTNYFIMDEMTDKQANRHPYYDGQRPYYPYYNYETTRRPLTSNPNFDKLTFGIPTKRPETPVTYMINTYGQKTTTPLPYNLNIQINYYVNSTDKPPKVGNFNPTYTNYMTTSRPIYNTPHSFNYDNSGPDFYNTFTNNRPQTSYYTPIEQTGYDSNRDRKTTRKPYNVMSTNKMPVTVVTNTIIRPNTRPQTRPQTTRPQTARPQTARPQTRPQPRPQTISASGPTIVIVNTNDNFKPDHSGGYGLYDPYNRPNFDQNLYNRPQNFDQNRPNLDQPETFIYKRPVQAHITKIGTRPYVKVNEPDTSNPDFTTYYGTKIKYDNTLVNFPVDRDPNLNKPDTTDEFSDTDYVIEDADNKKYVKISTNQQGTSRLTTKNKQGTRQKTTNDKRFVQILTVKGQGTDPDEMDIERKEGETDLQMTYDDLVEVYVKPDSDFVTEPTPSEHSNDDWQIFNATIEKETPSMPLPKLNDNLLCSTELPKPLRLFMDDDGIFDF